MLIDSALYLTCSLFVDAMGYKPKLGYASFEPILSPCYKPKIEGSDYTVSPSVTGSPFPSTFTLHRDDVQLSHSVLHDLIDNTFIPLITNCSFLSRLLIY